MEIKNIMANYERLGRILIEIQNSDTSHFDELYDSTKKMVYFELKSAGVPEQNIEDLIQEVYIKFITKAYTISNPQALIKWLKTVSYTTGINYVKSAVNRREYLIEDDGEYIFEDEGSLSARISMPEDIMDNKETQRLVRNIVNSLPKTQFRIFVAYYYNEESVKEIADSMEISESSVKTQLFRGRKTIEAEVKELEKKHNTRLYTIAPLPLFALLFGQDVAAAVLPESVNVAFLAIKRNLEYIIPHSKVGAISAASTTAAKTGALSTGVKAVIIAASVTIVASTAVSVTVLLRNFTPQQEEMPKEEIEEIISVEEEQEEDIVIPMVCEFMDENGFKEGYSTLAASMVFMICYELNYDSSVTSFSEAEWEDFFSAFLANSWGSGYEENIKEPWSVPPTNAYIEEACYMVTGHHIPYTSNLFNEKYVHGDHIEAASPYLFDFTEENITINQLDNDTWEISYDFIYAPTSGENLDGKKEVTAIIKPNPDGGLDGYSIYALSVKRVSDATMKPY